MRVIHTFIHLASFYCLGTPCTYIHCYIAIGIMLCLCTYSIPTFSSFFPFETPLPLLVSVPPKVSRPCLKVMYLVDCSGGEGSCVLGAGACSTAVNKISRMFYNTAKLIEIEYPLYLL